MSKSFSRPSHPVTYAVDTAPLSSTSAPDTTAPTAEARATRRLTAAAFGWVGVIGLAASFVSTKAHYLYQFDARSFGPFWPYAGWLVPHIMAGVLALFLGPIQFRTALRRRYARVHRWMGRAYLAAVAVGATMSSVMLTRTEAGMGYRVGLGGLTLAWVSTTALAFTAIRRGNVAQHREWMVRSYVVTFGFVTFRVIDRALDVAAFGTLEDRGAIAAWGCWALPLLVTEFTIQCRKILRVPRRELPALPD